MRAAGRCMMTNTVLIKIKDGKHVRNTDRAGGGKGSLSGKCVLHSAEA